MQLKSWLWPYGNYNVALVCYFVCIHRDFFSGWAQEAWDQADCWLAGVWPQSSFCVWYQISYQVA